MKNNILGCERLSKEQEKEIMNNMFSAPTKYTIDNLKNKEFKNLLEVYIYCKKNNITSGNIYHNLNNISWGKVDYLIKKKRKEIIEKYCYNTY